MISITVEELRSNLSQYIETARRECVEIRRQGETVARLVAPYDEDDEILMRWLEIPEIEQRFAESRERGERGETVPEAQAAAELGASEKEIADEVARLDRLQDH